VTEPDAAALAEHISVIARLLRRSVLVQTQPFPMSLTPPQAQAMEILVTAEREGASLSLTELTTRMGLAHSTVSGIVTRLEQRGLVRRTTFPDDRRQLRIQLSETVHNWLTRDLPRLRRQPLDDALEQISGREVAALRRGLAKLRKHLESQR
jgi:DNA-binding MarR family transcriptional regulator